MSNRCWVNNNNNGFILSHKSLRKLHVSHQRAVTILDPTLGVQNDVIAVAQSVVAQLQANTNNVQLLYKLI